MAVTSMVNYLAMDVNIKVQQDIREYLLMDS
jgi:hypothetical protein